MVSLILAICFDIVFYLSDWFNKGPLLYFHKTAHGFPDFTFRTYDPLAFRWLVWYNLSPLHLLFGFFLAFRWLVSSLFAFWIFCWTQQQYPQPNPLLRFFRDLFGISSDGYTVCGANFLLVAILHQLRIFSCLTKAFLFLDIHLREQFKGAEQPWS